MKSVIVLFVIFMSHTLIAQEVINLWTEQPPYSKPNSLEETVIESWGVPCAKNVTNPTLTVYRANGGHGFGPGRPDDGTSQWLGLLANWIKRQ